MEFPEERDPMGQIVIEPVAELVGQEQHDGDDRSGDEYRQRGGLNRTKRRRQQIDHGATDQVVRKHGPAEDKSEDEQVEIEIAEIG